MVRLESQIALVPFCRWFRTSKLYTPFVDIHVYAIEFSQTIVCSFTLLFSKEIIMIYNDTVFSRYTYLVDIFALCKVYDYFISSNMTVYVQRFETLRSMRTRPE